MSLIKSFLRPSSPSLISRLMTSTTDPPYLTHDWRLASRASSIGINVSSVAVKVDIESRISGTRGEKPSMLYDAAEDVRIIFNPRYTCVQQSDTSQWTLTRSPKRKAPVRGNRNRTPGLLCDTRHQKRMVMVIRGSVHADGMLERLLREVRKDCAARLIIELIQGPHKMSSLVRPHEITVLVSYEQFVMTLIFRVAEKTACLLESVQPRKDTRCNRYESL